MHNALCRLRRIATFSADLAKNGHGDSDVGRDGGTMDCGIRINEGPGMHRGDTAIADRQLWLQSRALILALVNVISYDIAISCC